MGSKEKGSPKGIPLPIVERADHAFRLCLSRDPRPEEASRLADLLDQQTKRFAERPEEARQGLGIEHGDSKETPVRAAWTFVARVLMNLDEFVTRE